MSRRTRSMGRSPNSFNASVPSSARIGRKPFAVRFIPTNFLVSGSSSTTSTTGPSVFISALPDPRYEK
jgi:hypothetical protein